MKRGAYVMGRNMFGPIRGEWGEEWRGWWGDEPPYHAPVFVLTHYAREPIEMEGGTTFRFVTDGFDAAYARAVAAAGEGEALFQGVEDPGLEPVDVIHSPKATHITYRVGR